MLLSLFGIFVVSFVISRQRFDCSACVCVSVLYVLYVRQSGTQRYTHTHNSIDKKKFFFGCFVSIASFMSNSKRNQCVMRPRANDLVFIHKHSLMLIRHFHCSSWQLIPLTVYDYILSAGTSSWQNLKKRFSCYRIEKFPFFTVCTFFFLTLVFFLFPSLFLSLTLPTLLMPFSFLFFRSACCYCKIVVEEK